VTGRRGSANAEVTKHGNGKQPRADPHQFPGHPTRRARARASHGRHAAGRRRAAAPTAAAIIEAAQLTEPATLSAPAEQRPARRAAARRVTAPVPVPAGSLGEAVTESGGVTL
jgi:hypothetical protein